MNKLTDKRLRNLINIFTIMPKVSKIDSDALLALEELKTLRQKLEKRTQHEPEPEPPTENTYDRRPKMKRIKPCPFCGKEHVTIERQMEAVWCQCRSCGGRGRMENSDENKAIDSWNCRRPHKNEQLTLGQASALPIGTKIWWEDFYGFSEKDGYYIVKQDGIERCDETLGASLFMEWALAHMIGKFYRYESEQAVGD